MYSLISILINKRVYYNTNNIILVTKKINKCYIIVFCKRVINWKYIVYTLYINYINKYLNIILLTLYK